jgi:5'-phosphate synthase pdxT subunit
VAQVKIGILALQGGVAEHADSLRRVGAIPVEVRLPAQIEGLEGMILPGGESTTIGKLARRFALIEALHRFAATRPIWGTCAGMILLAREIGTDPSILGVMDIRVQRNAFGRQVDSFVAPLMGPEIEDGRTRPFPAVFIRAPRLVSVGGRARVLARLADGTPVAAREDRFLATAFHPELTADNRFHRYFVKMVEEQMPVRPVVVPGPGPLELASSVCRAKTEQRAVIAQRSHHRSQ